MTKLDNTHSRAHADPICTSHTRHRLHPDVQPYMCAHTHRAGVGASVRTRTRMRVRVRVRVRDMMHTSVYEDRQCTDPLSSSNLSDHRTASEVMDGGENGCGT